MEQAQLKCSHFSQCCAETKGRKERHAENAEGREPERSVKSEKKRQGSSHGKMFKLREKGRKSRREKKD